MKQWKHLKEVSFIMFVEIKIHLIYFGLDGAIEALSGWTEMNNGRGNVKFFYF